jgi:hypothetical protein
VVDPPRQNILYVPGGFSRSNASSDVAGVKSVPGKYRFPTPGFITRYVLPPASIVVKREMSGP